MTALGDFAAWWPGIVALVSGTALGFLLGLVPGIGGRVAIIISLPMAAAFDPYPAAVFLFALHSIIHTSSSIPAIALGMPISSADAATVIDGYPLAKMGRAGEALGASLSASAIAGVLGALCFLAAIPIARPLVTSFGPPEILLLALFGITMVSSLSNQGLLPGIVIATLGALVGMVGLDFRSGEPRYTFGLIDLWEGVQLPAVVCGLFVIPEMLTVARRQSSEVVQRAVSTTIRDVYRGMFVTLRYRAVLLRSTLYGIMVGAAPTVGSTVGVWTAYGYAARTTKSEIPFGQGAIAGVIAPEAANNSKEGGAMIPTLFFAIPGSSNMAIMMAALSFVGVAVGPNMLKADIGLSYALAATVVFANLLAIPMFFAVVPSIVRLTALKRETIAPLAIAASLTAALITEPTLTTIVLIFLSSVLGVALKVAKWSRAPFILGFVLQQMAENAAFQTATIWGWGALQRPLTAVLFLCLLGWLAYSMRGRAAIYAAGPRRATIGLLLGLAAVFAAAMWLARSISLQGGLAPMVAAGVGLTLTLIVLVLATRQREVVPLEDEVQHLGLSTLYLAATPLAGLSAATFAYVAVVLARYGVRVRSAILVSALFGIVQLGLLALVFDLPVEREIIGRAAWAMLGY
jgi:putative tricarboxylic transport membrane protein